MVKLFLFLVSVQEFWSTITSQIRAATVGDAPRAAEPVALHRTPSSEPTRSSGGLLVDGRERFLLYVPREGTGGGGG